jgi:DEAD/DEAH box helicase domain-containing protein
MLEPLKGAQPTQPLLRTCVSVSFDAAEVIDRRYAEGEGGCLAEISMRVTDSVEGYRIGSTAMPYRELRKTNRRMCRRYREASSTGVVIRICEPWFAGSGDASLKTRHCVAEALKAVLAMEHNVAPGELRSAHQNISLCSLAGAKPIDDAVVVFDNVAGGLRLSAPLFSSFPALLDRLERAASLAGDEALLSLPTVERLRAWHAGLDSAGGQQSEVPALEAGELVVFAPESEVAVRIRGVLEERKLIEPQFLSMGEQDVLMYKYEAAPDVHAWVAHDQVQAIGSNWSQVIWNPISNHFREIEA